MKLINWWTVSIETAFDELAEYATRMEAQIAVMAKLDRERISVAELTEEDHDEALAQHYWLFAEALPRTLRYSCIGLLLTTIETALLRICRQMEKDRQLPLPVGALKGSALERSLTYIKKLGRVTLPAHSFEQVVTHLSTIRQCIVHAAGNIELMSHPTPKVVRDAARQLDGFGIPGDDFIEIAPGVCARLIRDASAWMRAVLGAAELSFRVEW